MDTHWLAARLTPSRDSVSPLAGVRSCATSELVGTARRSNLPIIRGTRRPACARIDHGDRRADTTSSSPCSSHLSTAAEIVALVYVWAGSRCTPRSCVVLDAPCSEDGAALSLRG